MTEEENKYYKYLESEQWKAIARKRLEIDDYTCQGCGSRGSPLNPLQVHHLGYRHIYNEEPYVYTELVSVCRCCHAIIHNIMNRTTDISGRRGWKSVSEVPKVNILVLSGYDLQQRKENFKDVQRVSEETNG